MSQVISVLEYQPPRPGEDIPLADLAHRPSFDPSEAVNKIIRWVSNIPDVIPVARECKKPDMPLGRFVVIMAALSGVNLLSSAATGFLTVGLPQIAVDLSMSEHLLSWPISVYALTCGSCLLLAGSIADIVGNRLVNLAGCFAVGIFIVACGLARDGIDLIMFRAMQGIAVSLCLPTAVAIVANSTVPGRRRNIAFSCLGMAQPFGFSAGMVLEGVLLDTIGWRVGFYISGGLTLILFLISIKALPIENPHEGNMTSRLKSEVDWVGALIAVAGLSLFSYVLAALTDVLSNIDHPAVIAMLVISVAMGPIFVLWERRQEKLNRPALIPNSLWENTVFTSICLMVVCGYAICNSMELFCSFFFQEVQSLSALQASLRILPSTVTGVILQLGTGLLIHRISAYYLVLGSLIINALSPLLMAIINVHWPYWFAAFPAQIFLPISCDILFTVGLLVVSDVFPTTTQALAGAVFNTVAQFGSSIGLTIMTVISASVTKSSKNTDLQSPAALMLGYRAGFWAAFATMGIACVVGGFGLRKMGKIGMKRD